VPGSHGEHELQERFGTATRARAFYDHQMLDRLNDRMQDFVRRMDMVFIATADGGGEADCSFRAGPAGFVCVLDERTLLLPEYRGNGVMGSLGNIAENGHLGLLFLDLCGDGIGLHVNGRVSIVENSSLLGRQDLPEPVVDGLLAEGGRRPACWLRIEVIEAYIHCSKHIPQMVRRSDVEQAWGTDDEVRKGGDYFKVKYLPRPWDDATAAPAAVPVDGPRTGIPAPRSPERPLAETGTEPDGSPF
jgi:predicted pyridoxine 5'-phosphate oxidase superfamily flavin-nucleotide-binding protein